MFPGHLWSSVCGKSHGQRSLAGYSPQGCKESDMTEHTFRCVLEASSGSESVTAQGCQCHLAPIHTWPPTYSVLNIMVLCLTLYSLLLWFTELPHIINPLESLNPMLTGQHKHSVQMGCHGRRNTQCIFLLLEHMFHFTIKQLFKTRVQRKNSEFQDGSCRSINPSLRPAWVLSPGLSHIVLKPVLARELRNGWWIS